MYQGLMRRHTKASRCTRFGSNTKRTNVRECQRCVECRKIIITRRWLWRSGILSQDSFWFHHFHFGESDRVCFFLCLDKNEILRDLRDSQSQMVLPVKWSFSWSFYSLNLKLLSLSPVHAVQNPKFRNRLRTPKTDSEVFREIGEEETAIAWPGLCFPKTNHTSSVYASH